MQYPVDHWTVGRLLDTAARYLRAKGSTSPRLDAELLLAKTLGVERLHLYTEFDRPLTGREVSEFRALVARRTAHEPVAYILGRSHFRYLQLEVAPAVLIPRPETEELVEVALQLLRRRPPWEALEPAEPSLAVTTSSVDTAFAVPPSIVDVGTGSGAIALSLVQESGLRVLATDVNGAALELAARNASSLGLERLVEFRHTDLLVGVDVKSLHLVVSNPPYVASGDIATLAPDVRLFEPVSALDGGPDGLAVLRRLFPAAAEALRPGGSVLVEVGDTQASAAADFACEAGFAIVEVHRDLSGKERTVEATLPGAYDAALTDLDKTRYAALEGALEAGGVIGIPTDTVYGLAALWDSRAGIERLFQAKGRPPGQPVAVLFPSVDAVEQVLPDLAAESARVLRALLPGAFTFVVETTVPRPSLVGTEDSLGVRVPSHPELLALLRSLGRPLAATSANRTGNKAVAALTEVDPGVLAHCSIAFAVSGDASSAGQASTVIDLRPLSAGDAPKVLREGSIAGAVALERIAAVR